MAWLGVIVLAVLAAAVHAASPSQLVVVTYNVCADDISVQERIPALMKVLDKANADIYALQEVEPWLKAALDKSPWYHKKGYTITEDESNTGNIFMSKYPIKSVLSVPLADSVERRDEKVVEIDVGGEIIRLSTSHLDANTPLGKVRAAELAAMFRDVATPMKQLHAAIPKRQKQEEDHVMRYMQQQQQQMEGQQQQQPQQGEGQQPQQQQAEGQSPGLQAQGPMGAEEAHASSSEQQIASAVNMKQVGFKDTGNTKFDTLIVLGDFNFGDEKRASAENAVKKRFSNFTDVWRKLHPSARGYTWDTKKNAMAVIGGQPFNDLNSYRDDHMLISSKRWKPQSITLIGTSPVKPGDKRLFPSDHYGLRAVFTLKAGSKSTGSKTAAAAPTASQPPAEEDANALKTNAPTPAASGASKKKKKQKKSKKQSKAAASQSQPQAQELENKAAQAETMKQQLRKRAHLDS